MGMSSLLANNLKWWPRVLAIIYIAFISVFALNVFGPNFSFGALFVHLLPSAFLTICLVIAWKRELIGSVLFGSFAIAYVVMNFFQLEWAVFLIVGSPPLAVGVLFFAAALAKVDVELVEALDENGRKTGEVLTRETASAQGLRYGRIGGK